MKVLRAAGVFLITTAMYLGVVVLGWSLAAFQAPSAAFFAFPVHWAYSLVVMVFAGLVGIQSYTSMEGIQDSQGLEESRVTRQRLVGAILVISLFVGLLLLPFTSRLGIGTFTPFAVLLWAGVALCMLGYLFIYWSGIALGRQYSAEVVLQKDHQLITSGPYHLIRHPRYLGILCLILGISLLFHSWIGLALCLPVTGLILSRIHDEELLLGKTFGDIWAQYTRRSWRLLPHLY